MGVVLLASAAVVQLARRGSRPGRPHPSGCWASAPPRWGWRCSAGCCVASTATRARPATPGRAPRAARVDAASPLAWVAECLDAAGRGPHPHPGGLGVRAARRARAARSASYGDRGGGARRRLGAGGRAGLPGPGLDGAARAARRGGAGRGRPAPVWCRARETPPGSLLVPLVVAALLAVAQPLSWYDETLTAACLLVTLALLAVAHRAARNALVAAAAGAGAVAALAGLVWTLGALTDRPEHLTALVATGVLGLVALGRGSLPDVDGPAPGRGRGRLRGRGPAAAGPGGRRRGPPGELGRGPPDRRGRGGRRPVAAASRPSTRRGARRPPAGGGDLAAPGRPRRLRAGALHAALGAWR